jgi:ribosomal protein S1
VVKTISKTSKSKPKRSVGKIKTTSKVKKTSEPKTMDELMAAYGEGFKSFTRGDKVEGEVLEITKSRVIISTGGKSEGLVAEKAFKEAQSYVRTLKVGDIVKASVIVPETPEGFTILSLREAVRNSIWKKIEESLKNMSPISLEVKSVNSSGVMVDVSGLTGFIPRSQLGKEAQKNTQSLIGTRVQAVVIDADREARKIVLSEKEVSEKEELDFARDLLAKVKEDDVYEGIVSSIYDFGCFVRISLSESAKKKKNAQKAKSANLEGLVHISELSWDKVKSPSDFVSVGDKVKVKVIGKTRGKLALSIKQAQKDPWDDIEKKYNKDKKAKGTVVRLSDFGMFVGLEAGVEGLVHMTKIPPGKKYSRGDEVKIYVEDVDKENRKLSLGLVLTEKPVGYK